MILYIAISTFNLNSGNEHCQRWFIYSCTPGRRLKMDTSWRHIVQAGLIITISSVYLAHIPRSKYIFGRYRTQKPDPNSFSTTPAARCQQNNGHRLIGVISQSTNANIQLTVAWSRLFTWPWSYANSKGRIILFQGAAVNEPSLMNEPTHFAPNNLFTLYWYSQLLIVHHLSHGQRELHIRIPSGHKY